MVSDVNGITPMIDDYDLPGGGFAKFSGLDYTYHLKSTTQLHPPHWCIIMKTLQECSNPVGLMHECITVITHLACSHASWQQRETLIKALCCPSRVNAVDVSLSASEGLYQYNLHLLGMTLYYGANTMRKASINMVFTHWELHAIIKLSPLLGTNDYCTVMIMCLALI